MAEELTNARAALQRQTREAQGAIQDLLLEREEFSSNMVLTHRYMYTYIYIYIHKHIVYYSRSQLKNPEDGATSTGSPGRACAPCRLSPWHRPGFASGVQPFAAPTLCPPFPLYLHLTFI